MSITAYETGTATGPADLLTKLGTFAAANGWTVNTPASGKVFTKGTVLAGLFANTASLDLRGAITYAAGNAWNAQTNNAGRTTFCDVGAGPFTAYHFFVGAESGNDYLHAVVEITAGVFRHFVLGQLVKAGSFTGGTYVDSTDWDESVQEINDPEEDLHQVICDAESSNIGGRANGHVWADFDALTNNWARIRETTSFTQGEGIGSVRRQGLTHPNVIVGSQAWSERTPLWPLWYFGNRASSLRSLLGRIPDMRLINIANFVPGQTITVGAETWQVFPIIARPAGTITSSTSYSGDYGYAYRR